MASGSPIDPSFQYTIVTPSDTAVLQYNSKNQRCKAISFATAGALAIKDDEGNTKIIPANSLVPGIMHPVSTDQILSTGTTVTGIVAYF